MKARHRRGEAGFTMIELTLSIVILGLITLPLGSMMIGYYKNSVQTGARLSESHDVQIATAYFAQDVAAIGRRDSTDTLQQSVWSGSAAGAPYACGSGTNVLLLAWDEYTAPTTSKVVEVAYTTRILAGERQLVRWSCRGPSATRTSVVLAHDVDPSTAPMVSCLPTPTCASPASATLQLQLSIKDSGSREGSYLVTLRGDRRQS